MTRINRGNVAKKRRKKVLNLTKGFRGASSLLFRTANQQKIKALRYSYRDRNQRKRQFCALWIPRINAASRQYGLNYSRFRHELKKINIFLNRKVLGQLAIRDTNAFYQLTTCIN